MIMSVHSWLSLQQDVVVMAGALSTSLSISTAEPWVPHARKGLTLAEQ